MFFGNFAKFVETKHKAMETTKKEFYIISYGLGGGFGGRNIYDVIKATSLEDAETQAWQQCCEVFEQYAGSNGLRDIGEIMEEEGVDEDEAVSIFEEERESWLDYTAVKFSKSEDEKAKSYHYNNFFEDETNLLD